MSNPESAAQEYRQAREAARPWPSEEEWDRDHPGSDFWHPDRYRREYGPPLAEITLVTAASYAGVPVPTREWLVKDLVPDRAVTLLSGDGGVGKSLLAMQLGVAVAAAKNWLGMLPSFGPVLYASAEDDEDEIHRRLADITASCDDLDFTDLADLHLLHLAGRDAVLATSDGKGTVSATDLWRGIVGRVREIRPRLLILDNLADVFAGNENVRAEARQFVGILRTAAIESHLAVVLLGHPSLTGISSGSGSSGSTAWSNSVRSRLYLDRAKADDGDEPDPDLRVLRVMKANYAPTGTEIRVRWQKGVFRLEGGGAGMFDRVAAEAKADRTFMDLLRSYQSQGRDVSPNPSRTFAPTLFAADPGAGGIRSKVFTAAMNRLFKAGAIKIETSGPPSKQKRRLAICSE